MKNKQIKKGNRSTGYKFHPKNRWDTTKVPRTLCVLKHYSGIVATITEYPITTNRCEYWIEVKSGESTIDTKLNFRNANFDYTDVIFSMCENQMRQNLRMAGIMPTDFGKEDEHLRVGQFKERRTK